jgi:hypothetical protein
MPNVYSTASLEGINTLLTYTAYDQTAAISSTNDPSNPGPPFAIGTTCESVNGGEFMFVKASSAIAQYDFVGISTNFNAASLSVSTTSLAPIVACAQVAIASGSYGWVCLRGGGISGNVLASAVAGAALYATATAGSLDDAAFSSLQPKIDGVVCTTTKNSIAGNTPVLMSYPTIVV